MLYSFNSKNLPFVGKGRQKAISLTKARYATTYSYDLHFTEDLPIGKKNEI